MDRGFREVFPELARLANGPLPVLCLADGDLTESSTRGFGDFWMWWESFVQWRVEVNHEWTPRSTNSMDIELSRSCFFVSIRDSKTAVNAMFQPF